MEKQILEHAHVFYEINCKKYPASLYTLCWGFFSPLKPYRVTSNLLGVRQTELDQDAKKSNS